MPCVYLEETLCQMNVHHLLNRLEINPLFRGKY